jgi:exosortase
MAPELQNMRLLQYTEKPLFQIVTLGILVLALYFSVIVELVHDWIIDENYSHGFLIPLVSAFFIWRKRERLRTIKRSSSGIGLVVVVLGFLLFILGSIGAEYFTQRLSLLVVIGGLVLYLGGRGMAGGLLFPMLYLVFMIPVPYVLYYSISFPLELLASSLTSGVVSLLGIPIIKEGNILHLQNTTLQVVDACSGLRSLLSLSALAAALAYVTQRTLVKGIILFLVAVPVAIGANILRLSMTAILASLGGEQMAQGFLHQFSGVAVFAFAVVSLSLIGAILRWMSFKKDTGSPSS